MRYLGLDLGTNTGWALLDEGELHSTWKSKYPKKGEDNASRFVAFRNDLVRVINEHQVDVIAYEDVNPRVHRSNAQRHLWAGWLTVLLMVSLDLGVEVVPVNLKTAKAVAGHGSFSKTDMEAAGRARWKLPVIITEDQVDACWAAETARVKRKR